MEAHSHAPHRYGRRIGGALSTSLVLAATAFSAQAGILANPIPAPIAKSALTIELQSIASGLSAPNLVTHAGDGSNRLFVVDQPGQIHLIKNGVKQATPFLDTSSRLTPLGLFGIDYDERGLLGLAFHPEFENPNSSGFGRFYTYTSETYVPHAYDYTVDLNLNERMDHQSVIAEWRVSNTNPDMADPSSRRELLRIDQPQFNHNGGMIEFGPDGNLYIGIGDGGNADDVGPGHGTGNGQDLTNNVLGKILRVDVQGHDSRNGEYGIPSNNPFLENPNVAQEVYAYGFRNPYRFSFDSETGDLIVGDVGQNKVEEVDIVTAGGNYGWNLKEGTFKFVNGEVSDDLSGLPGDLIDPVLQYDHDEGISVIGGFVYRGNALPDLFGKYIFGDFSPSFVSPLGRLFVADLATGLIEELRIGLNDRALGYFIKGMGQDADGELYLAVSKTFAVHSATGEIFKIVAAPVPLPAAIWLLGGALGALSFARRRTAN